MCLQTKCGPVIEDPNDLLTVSKISHIQAHYIVVDLIFPMTYFPFYLLSQMNIDQIGQILKKTKHCDHVVCDAGNTGLFLKRLFRIFAFQTFMT